MAFARAVFAVLIFGGLRRREVCDLHKSDVATDTKSILIRSGKGGKSRKVYLCDKAVAALKEWLALRDPASNGTNPASCKRY